jgi:hypothetical protein
LVVWGAIWRKGGSLGAKMYLTLIQNKSLPLNLKKRVEVSNERKKEKKKTINRRSFGSFVKVICCCSVSKLLQAYVLILLCYQFQEKKGHGFPPLWYITADELDSLSS